MSSLKSCPRSAREGRTWAPSSSGFSLHVARPTFPRARAMPRSSAVQVSAAVEESRVLCGRRGVSEHLQAGSAWTRSGSNFYASAAAVLHAPVACRFRSSERRSWAQISKQRRWSLGGLVPGVRASPSIASWARLMLWSHPPHVAPNTGLPHTRDAISSGRRPLSSLLRMICRIVSVSIPRCYRGKLENDPSGDSLSHRVVFPVRCEPAHRPSLSSAPGLVYKGGPKSNTNKGETRWLS